MKKNVILILALLTSLMLSGCVVNDKIEQGVGFIMQKISDAKEDDEDYYDEEYDEDYEEEVNYGDIDYETGYEKYDEFSVTPLPTMGPENEYEEQIDDSSDEGIPEDVWIDEETDASLDDRLSQERYYAYSTLDADERAVYKLIYTTLFDFAEKTPMPTLDTAMVDNVFACVLADSPELFYVKGYNLVKYERGGKLEKIAVSGIYTMNSEQADAHMKKVDAYVSKCLAGAPQTADDYEKVKYLYEYIVKNTEYDLDAANGQNYLSVFENGRSVCQGYSTAMQYMLNKLGVFCTIVRGLSSNGENHSWNLVKADGDYYYVDVTWGDSSYDVTIDSKMASAPKLPEVNYEYLCVTTKELLKTHKIDNYFPVPECVATKNYYFVREGNYFDTVDEDRLDGVFKKAYEDGKDSAVIKCADSQVFGEMKRYLTDEGNIFNYLKDAKNVNYVTLDSAQELIFYL